MEDTEIYIGATDFRKEVTPTYIRSKINEGHYVVGILLTSTLLESELFRCLKRETGLSDEHANELFGKSSLGYLLEKSRDCDVFPGYEDTLNQMRSGDDSIVNIRNNLVHDWGYFDEVHSEAEIQGEVERACSIALDFIEEIIQVEEK